MFNVRIVLGIVVFLIYNHAESAAEHRLPRVVTPLPAPKISDLPQVSFQFLLLCFFSEMVLVYLKKKYDSVQ
ncbi:hypothetical protein VIGAN_01199800 [Vigna angularis var. angularis]|uniref:Secreted protein n=1 Tax=Vigna angularis var. angularis TaxID=157739 RepID=A0A0S3R173_PHAAN|nr:hypothetical protein VIGAN_01199800 [Vigna angularis var. angularis]